MRGTPSILTILGFPSGIIPAHAGNTRWNRSGSAATRDHPRACGEHWNRVIAAFTLSGSSPRMRGTPSRGSPHSGQSGIIPAHAGNTNQHRGLRKAFRDHPRACGEHRRARRACVIALGSSPRMRGTPVQRRSEHHQRRIIPAHAGNTANTSHTSASAGDHPRACGEHLSRPCTMARFQGSSPRMRGTLRRGLYY